MEVEVEVEVVGARARAAVTALLRLLAAVGVVRREVEVSVAPEVTATEPQAEIATVRAQEPAPPDRGPGVIRQDLEAPQSLGAARRIAVVLRPEPAEGAGNIPRRR